MPRLSVWLIRAALFHLAAGFGLGALLLWNKGLPLSPSLGRWLPVHIEVVLFGWLAQLALGVAYWILPRFHTERRRAGWAAAAFVLLNVGVWTVGLAAGLGWPAAVSAFGRGLEALAFLAFAWHAWPRVKPLAA